MKVTKEKTENSQAFLTIEMEPAEVEESLEEAYQRLVKRTNVPGFRKGKAPRTILERHIGKDNLLENALNNLIPKAYDKAIKEQAIEPIAPPQVEVVQNEPVIFKAVVPLRPTVKLGDYQQVRLSPEQAAVPDENVNMVMEQLRHQHATWEPVTRPVAFGDLVAIDIWSNIENKPFINQKGGQYQVIKDSSFPVAGFPEQLVGMNKDEEKEFSLKFPADYPTADLAGKEPHFKIRINEIKQEILPELNDEFAAVVNPETKTVAALREKVVAEMQQRAEERVRTEFEEKVINAVADLSQAEFPPVLVEDEIHSILHRRFEKGDQEIAEYLKNAKKTEKELEEEIRPLATKRVTQSLVLEKVAEAEKIDVTDAEVDNDIESMMKRAQEKDKEKLTEVFNTPQARESVRQTLLTKKTIQRLVEIARGSEEIATTPKEEGK